MPLNSTTIKEVNRPVQARKGDVLQFARLLARGHPASKAKVQAGYSKSYDTSKLLSTQLAQQAIAQVNTSISEAREQLSQVLGYTFTDSCEVDKEIRDDTEVPPGVRLKANENIDKKLGYLAPTQIQTESRALLMGFNNLDGEDLEKLLNYYSGNEG